MKSLIGIIVLLAIGTTWSLVLDHQSGSDIHFFGYSGGQTGEPKGASGLWLASWTLVGILSRVLYDTLHDLPAKERTFGKVFVGCFSDYRTWGAFAFSPLVILMFWDPLNHIENNRLTALVSYQNGFFVKALFDIK